MKKSKLLIFLMCFILMACNSQIEEKRILARKFIEKVVINDSYNIKNVHEYINIPKDSINENGYLFNIVKFNLEFLRHKLKKDTTYEILTYKEFHSKDYFKNYEILYENKDNIFLLVTKNKLFSSIIINDKSKIISFYGGNNRPKLIKNTRKADEMIDEKTIKPFIFEK